MKHNLTKQDIEKYGTLKEQRILNETGRMVDFDALHGSGQYKALFKHLRNEGIRGTIKPASGEYDNQDMVEFTVESKEQMEFLVGTTLQADMYLEGYAEQMADNYSDDTDMSYEESYDHMMDEGYRLFAQYDGKVHEIEIEGVVYIIVQI